MSPTPKGTRFRVKRNPDGSRVRLAFAPGTDRVIETKKLGKKKSQRKKGK